MDADSPWEEDPQVDHVPEAEWKKITSEFTNSGYREGITAGKEAFLQAGFDAGFAEVGVLGRELGSLRGTAAAIGAFLNSQKLDSPDLEELRSISSALSTIRFSDIVPPDLEAEQHAKEHLDSDVGNIEPVAETSAPRQKHRMEDIGRLKERLTLLKTKLGLHVASTTASPQVGMPLPPFPQKSSQRTSHDAQQRRPDDFNTMRT